MSFPRSLPIVVSLLCCGWLLIAVPSATAAGKAAKAAPQDSIVWRGDIVSARGFMDDLATQFQKAHKGHITLQPFSTISGLDAVAAGRADLAGSARGKYARRAEEANINFIPVALDAIVAITHPRNPAHDITLAQLRDVYLGRITNWKDLGGNDTPINLYAIAAPLDGVEFSLRALLFRNGDQRVAAPRLYLNTAKLEEGVALDPAGFGLSTLSSSHANKGVKMLSIEGVAPSMAHVADGSYALFNTLYLGDNATTPNKPETDAFIAFIDTPAARETLRRHQLVPYDEAGDVNALDAARMARVNTELFPGAPATAIAITAPANTTPTPVSAPNATLAARTSIAPTAESTQQARIRAASAAAANEEHAAASAKALASKSKAAHKAKALAVGSAAKAHKKVQPKALASAQHAKAKKTAKPAKASFANVKAAAVPATKKPAAAKFDNVKGAATAAKANGG